MRSHLLTQAIHFKDTIFTAYAQLYIHLFECKDPLPKNSEITDPFIAILNLAGHTFTGIFSNNSSQ